VQAEEEVRKAHQADRAGQHEEAADQDQDGDHTFEQNGEPAHSITSPRSR
jgi:hypothetical protein